MTDPYATQSTPKMTQVDIEALRHAAGGIDIITYIRELERRIERLEAQVLTN